jgi:hypothetical protein
MTVASSPCRYPPAAHGWINRFACPDQALHRAALLLFRQFPQFGTVNCLRGLSRHSLKGWAAIEAHRGKRNLVRQPCRSRHAEAALGATPNRLQPHGRLIRFRTSETLDVGPNLDAPSNAGACRRPLSTCISVAAIVSTVQPRSLRACASDLKPSHIPDPNERAEDAAKLWRQIARIRRSVSQPLSFHRLLFETKGAYRGFHPADLRRPDGH